VNHREKVKSLVEVNQANISLVVAVVLVYQLMMIRPYADAGYKGVLANDERLSTTSLVIGSGS
jgi:hypothetical protein